MTRCLSVFAATLAVLVPMADLAEAHERHQRDDGVVRLRIGPIEFRSATPRVQVQRRRSVMMEPAFPYEEFEAEGDFVFEPVQNGYGNLPQRDRARALLLDQDLGRALNALRQDLTVRGEPVRRFVPTITPPLPEPTTRRIPEPRDSIEVTRLPDAGSTPVAPRVGVIIQEEAVLGLVPLNGGAAPSAPIASGVTSVGVASAADVATHGADAFAVLSHPQSLGLPDATPDQAYFVLHGKVVTLDAEAQRALTVAALRATLQ